MFWSNLGFVGALTLILALCGWWAVAPFRRSLPFALAQAPLAGMLLLPMGTLALTVVARVRFDRAVVSTAVLLAGLSAWSAFRNRRDARIRSARPCSHPPARPVGGRRRGADADDSVQAGARRERLRCRRRYESETSESERPRSVRRASFSSR